MIRNLGKKAYRKSGLFEGYVGTIEESATGITPFKITFDAGGAVGFSKREHIHIIGVDSEDD